MDGKLEERLFAKYGGKGNLSSEAQEQVILRFLRNFWKGGKRKLVDYLLMPFAHLQPGLRSLKKIATKLEEIGLATDSDESYVFAKSLVSSEFHCREIAGKTLYFRQIPEKDGSVRYQLYPSGYGMVGISRDGTPKYDYGPL